MLHGCLLELRSQARVLIEARVSVTSLTGGQPFPIGDENAFQTPGAEHLRDKPHRKELSRLQA